MQFCGVLETAVAGPGRVDPVLLQPRQQFTQQSFTLVKRYLDPMFRKGDLA